MDNEFNLFSKNPDQHTPESPHKSGPQKGVGVTVNRVIEMAGHDDEGFQINTHACKGKSKYINFFMEGDGESQVRTDMEGGKGH